MYIESICAERYKSFQSFTEIKLRGLTILSGANSSGKSSIMQPVLLFKQTLHAGYDPGPLLINGPNVIFSETVQMQWGAHGGANFRIGVGVRDENIILNFIINLIKLKDSPTPLKIQDCVWKINGSDGVLREEMSMDEIGSLGIFTSQQRDRIRKSFQEIRKQIGVDNVAEDISRPLIKRAKIFLVITSLANLPFFPNPIIIELLEQAIRKVIHVPGLRGNPRRTYPVTAVEEEFPGLFQEYVASIIAHWQKRGDSRLVQLGKNLTTLGLTWKVQARQKSDTEVELLVGRFAESTKGGGKDLISVADVGFGVSQSLPVAVALLTATPGQLVYIEQPEIHLHPKAQVALAELIKDAIDRGVQVVIETHSELLLLGIQKLIALGKIPKDKTILYWFTKDKNGASHISEAEFDEHGSFGDVPIDFSEVNMQAMREYLDASLPGSR